MSFGRDRNFLVIIESVLGKFSEVDFKDKDQNIVDMVDYMFNFIC